MHRENTNWWKDIDPVSPLVASHQTECVSEKDVTSIQWLTSTLISNFSTSNLHKILQKHMIFSTSNLHKILQKHMKFTFTHANCVGAHLQFRSVVPVWIFTIASSTLCKTSTFCPKNSCFSDKIVTPVALLPASVDFVPYNSTDIINTSNAILHKHNHIIIYNYLYISHQSELMLIYKYCLIDFQMQDNE